MPASTTKPKPAKKPKPAPAAPAFAPELAAVDPATLIVGVNVRIDTKLDSAFLASITERGVLEPIHAYRNGEGALVVLRGQRRTVAATQLGLATVPVVIVGEPDNTDRVVDQLAENDHRAPLDDTERYAAMTQLAAFGLPAAAIAKKTATSRDTVNQALTLAASARAQEARAQHPTLTVDTLVLIAEFDNDGDHQAVEAITAAAEKGGRSVAHTAQQLRDSRDLRRATAAAEAALTDAGIPVVEEPKYNDPKRLRLRVLLDGTGSSITDEAHASCPGHAAYVETFWVYPGDDEYPKDREVPDPDDDDDDDDDKAAHPYAGPVYLCLDWRAHGHTARYQNSATTAGPTTDEDRAAAADERRGVIAGNKAWDSATIVRRKWLRNLLQRKTAPAGAVQFIGESFVRRDHAMNHAMSHGMPVIRDVLGLQPESSSHGLDYQEHLRRRNEVTNLIAAASDSKALLLTLGLFLCAYEQVADRGSWRRPPGDPARFEDGTARYLSYLETIGYELAEIERRAMGDNTSNEEDQ